MLSNDYDLTSSDIQQLSSADAVAGLFTTLGYDTAQRIPQTAVAMGLPESLAREVTRIERIADEEQGALQVYLVELKHVAVVHIQTLARFFKSRAGLFLLVLTTPDYERLDFVLFEPTAPDVQGRPAGGFAAAQIVLRPRILSVKRSNPDPVSRRVLRRFSYTEIDADYQWDKLRSAYGVAEWSEPLFNNRALFSDYYLNERLPNRDEWKEDPHPSYHALSNLLVDVRQKFSNQSEEKLRLELLEPAFQVLGWSIQAGKGPRDESTDQPDYWLKTPNGKKVPCLAYGWDRALDGPDDKRDADTPRENPAQTVVSVLNCAEDDCAGWAIMTNGKTWRLYSAHAHSRATNYYEIDLEETLASPDLADAFRYFWLLFRAESFKDQPAFVDSLLTESESYAKALGERLKDRVFEQVFPHFAEGFVQQWGRPAVELSDEELTDTYHATLTFLYRLLFLLYAEARDLLPVRETRGYWEISLDRMKKEIAEKAGEISDLTPERLKRTYSATTTDLYDQLNGLFQVVDKGDATLNVPMYNGGLFVTLDGTALPEADETEAEEVRAARFLCTHKIPDRSLALGLDLLSRDIDEKSQALAMIDYKSLGVRQLGSIYEGLLEFKLRVTSEKMAVVAGKKGDEIVPYAEAQKKGMKIRQTGKGAERSESVIHKGDVYLENDKHERKASGSYYTPDYIVKYIVQNTVGPALEAKTDGLRPKLREAQKAYHAAMARQQAFQKMGQKGDDPEKTAYTFRGLVDELFDLRVLDPAMGSGHFLVEAVDYLTDGLLAFLNAFPWNPVTAALRQTRLTILDEMQKQGVNIDPARLTDVNLLKRHVLKRCIYGVDLNPMAVELAKVSLWLDCFTLGAPLSFLDHHLKCGNSLIGVRIEEVRAAIEMAAEQERLEIPLLVGVMGGSQFAGVMMSVDLMRRVGELSDVTAAQVKESRTEFRKAADALAPYKRILDVYTSRWFGNADTKLDQPAISFLRDERNLPWIQNPTEHTPSKPATRIIAETALKVAREKRFFHWELEFPEVFFGASQVSQQQIVMKKNPGFDAVIGNPPYDELSDDSAGYEIIERAFLQSSPLYQPTKESGGRPNWYHFFMLLGVHLVKSLGMQGYIVPMSWIGDTFTSGVRRWLMENHRPVSIDCFPQKDDPKNRVFQDAKLSTTIYIVQKNRTQGGTKVRMHPGKDIISTSFYIVEIDILEKLSPGTVIIPITSVIGWEILKNVAMSPKLGAWGELAAKPTSGEIIFNDDTRPYMTEDNSYDLILRGGHIQRYELLDDARQGTPIYLKTAEYLASSRADSKAFGHKKPRIVYQEGSAIDAWRRVVSTYLPAGYICGHKVCYFVDYKVDELCLLGVFGSRLINWLVESLSSTNSLPAYLISNLPFPRFDFYTSSERRMALADEAQSFVIAGNESGLLGFVTSRLITQPKESDAVHDLLASLAQRMIDLNKQKQTEMKRFLGWLEGLLKASVDDLTGKSKLKNYLGDYQKSEPELSFGELEDILYKNKGKLGIALGEARLMAKLREEFEQSLAVLRPLKASLAWTDVVIDQVVYKLYGLTEEEIKVVEGKE